MHARAYLERNSCLFLLSQKSGPAISRGGRVGWTGRFWGLGKLADSVVRDHPLPGCQGGTRKSPGCVSYRNTDDNQVPTLSGSLGWRCRMTNDQKKSCSFVPPSRTGSRGTRTRWFQVNTYKKPVPEHSGPYIFQGRWGGVAGWQTARIDKDTVLCVPAALSLSLIHI